MDVEERSRTATQRGATKMRISSADAADVEDPFLQLEQELVAAEGARGHPGSAGGKEHPYTWTKDDVYVDEFAWMWAFEVGREWPFEELDDDSPHKTFKSHRGKRACMGGMQFEAHGATEKRDDCRS